jgi:hypothetical protein
MNLDSFYSFLKREYKKIGLIISVFLLAIAFVMLLLDLAPEAASITVYTGVGIFLIITIISFYQFFTGPKRAEHELTSAHASFAISMFYRIYFPVIILSIIVQFLIIVMLGSGLIDPAISPMGHIVLIVPSIIVGLGIIALVDHEMKENRLTYSPLGKKMSLAKALVYMLPLLGLYFGLTAFLKFIVVELFGQRTAITAVLSPFSIDSNVITASRSWVFLSGLEKSLVLIGFLVVYIALEVFLRGYLANASRSFKLGPAGMIFIPAVIQAAAFSSGVTLFTDPLYYFLIFFNGLLFGIIVGIALWRTERFSIALTLALLLRLLDPNHNFYRTFLLSLPDFFGKYDVFDSVITLSDQIGSTIAFIHVILIVIAPLIIIVAYKEVYAIYTSLRHNVAKQWFGYVIIAVAFIIIDIVFTLIMGYSSFLFIIGFVLALFIIRIILGLVYKLLPAPTKPITMESQSGFIKGEYPLDVTKDIQYLESERKWFANPILFASIMGLIYLYFLFVSASYRQYSLLGGWDIAKFTIFLVIIPLVLIITASYFISNAFQKGFFFGMDWRGQLLVGLTALLLISFYVWTKSVSTVNFSWRNTALFVAFFLVIWPREPTNPIRDFSYGFSRGGRYATFNWIDYKPKKFESIYKNLLDLPSDAISSGTLIALAKLDYLDEWTEIDVLRNHNNLKGEKIGRIISLGLIGTEASEAVLLQYIADEDMDVKIASYWSLGKVGTTKALHRMAQILEENPKQELVKIAEKAILNIDPNYPLAGLRDQVVIE